MTFTVYETSRRKGQPVNLFLFVHGEGSDSYLAYTNAEQSITYDAKVYQPIAIDRGNINSSGNLDKSTLVLRMQRDVEIATMFKIWPPSRVVSLIIREGHIGDPDAEFLVVWSGKVLSIAREGDESVVSGEPVSSSLRRPGLRRHYQIGCPHALYLPPCNANEAAATTTAVVEAISGNTVTLPTGWNPQASAKYLGGKVKWTTAEGDVEVRKILKITSDRVLQVSGILRGLTVGMTASVILGCAHNQDDCLNLHNNIHNYGGCDWIPTKNPFGFYNNYY